MIMQPLPGNYHRVTQTSKMPTLLHKVRMKLMLSNDIHVYIHCYLPPPPCGVAGPTEQTVGRFWQMVWENQLTTIVMLTRCVEDGKVSNWHRLCVIQNTLHSLSYIACHFYTIVLMTYIQKNISLTEGPTRH